MENFTPFKLGLAGPPSFHIDDKEYVVLPRADYDALLTASEAEDDEAMGRRLAAERDSAIAAGTHLVMPRDQWARIRAGENPVLVVRQHRNMTQAELSEASGVARPEISAIEAGKRRGTVDTFLSLSKALRAPVEVLAGPDMEPDLSVGVDPTSLRPRSV